MVLLESGNPQMMKSHGWEDLTKWVQGRNGLHTQARLCMQENQKPMEENGMKMSRKQVGESVNTQTPWDEGEVVGVGMGQGNKCDGWTQCKADGRWRVGGIGPDQGWSNSAERTHTWVECGGGMSLGKGYKYGSQRIEAVGVEPCWSQENCMVVGMMVKSDGSDEVG